MVFLDVDSHCSESLAWALLELTFELVECFAEAYPDCNSSVGEVVAQASNRCSIVEASACEVVVVEASGCKVVVVEAQVVVPAVEVHLLAICHQVSLAEA